MYRRDGLAALAAALALLAISPAHAEADPAVAAEFVRQTGRDMAGVVGDASTPIEKKKRLQPFLDRVADVDGVARFCLGRFWRVATPEQQQEYLRLFHAILLNGIVGRMTDYRPGTTMKVNVGQPVRHEDGVYVPTTVEREGNPTVRVQWVVNLEGPQPKLVDVIAEGMSLRLTQRSDYVAFINRNGGSVEALIKALQQQAAQNAGPS